ncbi:hypothetical protein BDV24DRAFT_176815 [Aspergillus arachidicola]|uniref:Uncharacterized protein n=1 Tax=Aspergillus arachidicola TaxID=656916 RepID=A0A5N6XYW7_9EURO|nr:hypothetical protein BDV24DRAFT_176815 [Aspergillus arachidicola]
MPYYANGIHTSLTSCLLYRQQASTGSLILDLYGNHLTVPTECTFPCSRCSKSPSPSIWFHFDCYDILKESYTAGEKPTLEDLQRFAVAVRPLYKPQNKDSIDTASTQEGLLCCFTSDILKDGFTQELFRQFPMEIQAMVLEFLGPCWYLIVLGETRCLLGQMRNDGLTQCERLNLTKGLYIGRTRYQGNSYISTISNKSLRLPSTYDLQHIKPPTYTKKIVLSIDQVGIRRLQFLERDSKPLPDGGPWYEILETMDCHFDASISWNGLFVRKIGVFAEGWDSTRRIWSSPEVPKLNPWNKNHVRDTSYLDHVKLGAKVQGLIFCYSQGNTIGIYGFTGISKAYETFRKLMNQRAHNSPAYWFYFPINNGELITAAWIRKMKYSSALAWPPALAVSLFRSYSKPFLLTEKIKTSLRRDIIFGPQPPSHLNHIYEFQALVQDGDGTISGIVHDGLGPTSTRITEIGVTCNPGCQVEAPGHEPQFGRYECPEIWGRSTPITTWYMTKASLEGLHKVRVCRDLEKSHRPCIGLLLYYEEGRIESLGQVRWDRDLTHDVLAPMYIEKGNIDGKDYIKGIQRDTACTWPESKVSTWRKIPENGTIVWWFGHLGDKVAIYKDPES